MFRRFTAAAVTMGAVLVMGCVPVAAFAAKTPTPSPSPSASPTPGPTATPRPTRSPSTPAPAAAPNAPRSGTTPSSPPRQREAVTSAFYQSILAKVRNDQSLIEPTFDNATAQEDVIDYGVDGLWKRGIDGAGTTVAIILSSPDPQLPQVLSQYSTALGLPQAQLTMMQYPASTPPATSCSFPQACGPGEDRLDAESIHTMAPYAKLLFVYTPIPETLGIQGWPQLGQAIEYVSSRHLADVITISEGDSEASFNPDPSNPGADAGASVHSMDPALLTAAANNVPLLFASGDCGTTQVTLLNEQTQCWPNTPQAAGHPADSPWVTSVGGSVPNAGLSTAAGRTGPDTLWNTSNFGNHNWDAEGAGVSTIYAQPSYQRDLPALQRVTGRSEPDLTLDAQSGTSQASPTLAGILSLATQYHRGTLGTINPALYELGPEGNRAGIVSLQPGGNNGIDGLPGYKVTTGDFNIADGWGTIYAPNFVPALSRTVNRQPALQARLQLQRLQSNTQVSRARGGQITVSGHGFVPGRMP
ncbi:MAG: S53 family peptidase, partial [Candidatus Dormibacteraceae bacterium]